MTTRITLVKSLTPGGEERVRAAAVRTGEARFTDYLGTYTALATFDARRQDWIVFEGTEEYDNPGMARE